MTPNAGCAAGFRRLPTPNGHPGRSEHRPPSASNPPALSEQRPDRRRVHPPHSERRSSRCDGLPADSERRTSHGAEVPTHAERRSARCDGPPADSERRTRLLHSVRRALRTADGLLLAPDIALRTPEMVECLADTGSDRGPRDLGLALSQGARLSTGIAITASRPTSRVRQPGAGTMERRRSTTAPAIQAINAARSATMVTAFPLS